MIRWAAIGDSFTYLNDHIDETGYRVSRGYLSRIADRIPSLQLNNIGINGSTFADWVHQEIPAADLYTVLLGTNDWHQGYPVGSDQDFQDRKAGTILGHLGILLDHIRKANPSAKIVVGNPVERADFVYLLDPENNAQGSYAPEHGQRLSDVAAAILKCCEEEGLNTVDLHTLSGFTQDRLVKFKRVRQRETYADLPYPDYIGKPFCPGKDEYPYPVEAIALTYDGLHPSDRGCQILADIFADKIEEMLHIKDRVDAAREFMRENPETRKEKSCGAVVYRKGGRGWEFLLEHMVQGHTSIPKGHVEEGETEEETALREIREETNLEVRLDTSFRHVITYSPAAGTIKDVVFFIAEARPGKMINQECEVTSLEWLPYEQAMKVLTHASDRETLRAANEYLKKQ